jgi:hypothetical protein
MKSILLAIAAISVISGFTSCKSSAPQQAPAPMVDMGSRSYK